MSVEKLTESNRLLKRLESVGGNVQNVSDRSVRQDPAPSRLRPTDGKNSAQTEKLAKAYLDFGPVQTLYRDIMNSVKTQLITTIDSETARLMKVEDSVLTIPEIDRLSLGIDNFSLITERMAVVMDLTKPTEQSIDDIRAKVASADMGAAGPVLIAFLSRLSTEILPKVKERKEAILSDNDVWAVQSGQGVLSAINDKRTDIPRRNLKKWVYDFELYYVRPDGERVELTTNIIEMTYTMEYDTLVMPVYSMILNVSHHVVRDFKENFDTLRFFMTVMKWPKDERKEGAYVVKQRVLDNQPMSPLDPEIPNGGVISDSPLAGMPSIRIKLDLVSKRNVDLNGKTKSKVYNDVTMLDVITALLSEAYLDQGRDRVSEKDMVKFVISPPDNVTVYEQIILDPGTIAQNLKQLQEKYGVYRTGIRVMFDTVTMEKDPATGAVRNQTVVTVQDKGGTAPPTNSVQRVLIEILDRATQTKVQEYDSGSDVIGDGSVMVVRTIEDYHVTKKNSSKIIDGDSVRVMSSSQNDWTNSECDIKEGVDSPQRTYWSGNDNPFAITQLQDDIRERYLMIAVQASNIDVYSLTENLKYDLKFYNQDDSVHSGEYRVKSIVFRFSIGGSLSVKTGVSVSAFMLFTNIPPVMLNGVLAPRESYLDKVGRMAADVGYFTGKVAMGAATAIGNAVSGKKGGPFVPIFAGRTDYLNQTVPKEIPESYPMSSSIVFRDVYALKDGSYPERGHALCQEYDLFCNAQKFSKLLLDPIVAKFGKFPAGGGKMNSFFRYHVPSNGSSSSPHLVAMAADMALASGDGLCEAFHWIATSGLPFDQVILEGNGSQWRWIHVGMNVKGNNRKQVKISRSGKAHEVKNVRMSLFTSPDKAQWSRAMKEII